MVMSRLGNFLTCLWDSVVTLVITEDQAQDTGRCEYQPFTQQPVQRYMRNGKGQRDPRRMAEVVWAR